jgi:hypothetical protein
MGTAWTRHAMCESAFIGCDNMQSGTNAVIFHRNIPPHLQGRNFKPTLKDPLEISFKEKRNI